MNLVLYKVIKRIIDLICAVILLLLFGIPMFVISLIVKLTSKGPVFYWSDRVGINNTIFRMPKFRTMRIDPPPVATHLLENPHDYLTPIGIFLRKFIFWVFSLLIPLFTLGLVRSFTINN